MEDPVKVDLETMVMYYSKKIIDGDCNQKRIGLVNVQMC